MRKFGLYVLLLTVNWFSFAVAFKAMIYGSDAAFAGGFLGVVLLAVFDAFVIGKVGGRR
jgi:hypothetical protein